MLEVTRNESVYLNLNLHLALVGTIAQTLIEIVFLSGFVHSSLHPVFQEMEGMVAPNPMTADDLKVRTKKLGGRKELGN